VVVAACLALLPVVVGGFFPAALAGTKRLPAWVRVVRPAVLALPYVMVAWAYGVFEWRWFCVYALVPVAVAALLLDARRVDEEQRGNWRDFLVLALVGLAVDLRWLQPAWPAGLSAFNKVLLLDAGIYGFMALRRLNGVGFDLRMRWRDVLVGLREFAFYAPLGAGLGLALGFLHFHAAWPRPGQASGSLAFTFALIAIPEELFFRGWMQNLMERRVGRTWALILTSAIFGLAHFNKLSAHFNWRYVILAALAGVFYGRAWRAERRVGASALTHACVDTTWSLFFL
jgi:membrane protease YdiL (CAAX protease family)